jgi:hypothetical protein
VNQVQKMAQRRAKLEDDVRNLLLAYQEETGATPVSIEFHVLMNGGMDEARRLSIGELQIEVKL